jgi:hypothetical protein
LAHLLRKSKNCNEEKREKDSQIDGWQKKGSAFFWQGGIAKNVRMLSSKEK